MIDLYADTDYFLALIKKDDWLKKNAEKLILDLSDERINRIKEGRLDQSKTIRKFFLNSALRKTAVTLSAGETDEPVTCDIKRLIRLPYFNTVNKNNIELIIWEGINFLCH